MTTNYRPLEPGETLREGDECSALSCGAWFEIDPMLFGKDAGYCKAKFRRPLKGGEDGV